MLALLEDDTFLQILAACSEAHDGGSSLHADVPNTRRRIFFVGFAKRRRGPLS